MPPKANRGKKKAANGYKLPEPIPDGEIVTGLTKKKSWRIGKSIGVGGFGEIYLCSENTASKVGPDAPLALKIEPHENGPLFVEMNFYIRACQPQDIDDFAKKRAIKKLGMPVHRGSGSHMYKGEKYRFLVMDRYGKDLQKVFENGKKPFSLEAAYKVVLKVLDVIEYIHLRGYVHNDIKAQNLLLGHGQGNENNVYLVDFGLVSKYQDMLKCLDAIFQRDGVHHVYKLDPKKAHDGTIEYTSRDAHAGTHSRRSDLEILAYNLVHWMSGTLPWLDCLSNPTTVYNKKKMHMENIPKFLETCFGKNKIPAEVKEFLDYVADLNFEVQPDYDYCRKVFTAGLRKRKLPLDGKLNFSATKSPAKKGPKRPRVSEVMDVGDSSENDEVAPSPPKRRASRAKAPAKESARSTPKGRKKSAVAVAMKDSASQTSPAFVARAKAAKAKQRQVLQEKQSSPAVNHEMEEFITKAKGAARKATSILDNPTPAMQALLDKKKAGKRNPPKKTVSKSPTEDDDPALANPTPAMKALMEKRAAASGKRRKRV